MKDDSGAEDATRPGATQPGATRPGATGPDAAPGEGPTPGVRPGGAKRRRTASMKVSRPKPEPADEPRPEPTPAPPESRAVAQLREFLDGPVGTAVLLVTAAAAAMSGPLAIYSLFALTYVFRHRARRLVARVPLGPRTTLAVLIVLVGVVRELITWVAETLRDDRQTVLWHPQLGPHLLVSTALYVAWALGWSAALWWYRYRLAEALAIQAVTGLVLENFGQNLLIGLVQFPAGLVVLLYTMLISASTLGIAWLLAGGKLATLGDRPASGYFRYVAPGLLMASALALLMTVWGMLLQRMHILPAPSPDG